MSVLGESGTDIEPGRSIGGYADCASPQRSQAPNRCGVSVTREGI